MSRLIDPTICPDCRSPLDPAATCTSCGLRVSGPLAAQLWSLMVGADELVERLRVAPVPGGVAGGVPTGATQPGPALPHYPAPMRPTGGAARAPRRLPSASVPVVLLSLGALCLLVAATVFIAVTWSVLGLTGRTLVLLGFTAALASVAVALSRRGLRGAAETFWVVVAGMLTVDVLGACSADLFGLGALSWRGTSALVGTALVALGVGVGGWALRQPVRRLYGAETVSVLGAALLCVTNAWGAQDPAVATTVAVPLLVGAALLLRRTTTVSAYGFAGLGAASWVALVGIGWDRALETATLTGWWADVRGWPLVASAVLAVVAVQLLPAPERVRQAGAALALFPLVLLANAPVTEGTGTRDVLIACATVLVLGLVTVTGARTWALGAAALTAAGVAVLGTLLLAGPWLSLSSIDLTRDHPADLRLGGEHPAAPWVALVVALAMVGAAVCLLRRVSPVRKDAVVRLVTTLAPATLALGGLVVLLELEPPLWAAVLGAAVAAAAAGSAAWWSRGDVVAAGLGSAATAYLCGVLLVASATNETLAACATTGLFLVLAAVSVLREREDGAVSAPLAGVLAGLLGAWAVVAWGDVAGAEARTVALALAAYAGVLALVAAPVARRASTRITFELTAAAVAVLAAGSSVDDRNLAMVLTVLGTAVCLVTVSTRDRTLLGWVGAAVLGVATLIRLEVHVSAPELYTLPAAALLLAAGSWRLRQDRTTSSFAVLGSGLTLALLPSLLLAFEEPVSLRGALIGAAGVLTLAAGVQLRLSAPFVLGAVTTAVLALRHLQPVAEAVPRWISLGGVGLLLLLVGVTWEARRRDLDQAQRYLTALR